VDEKWREKLKKPKGRIKKILFEFLYLELCGGG
jgi:hypothetical protein